MSESAGGVVKIIVVVDDQGLRILVAIAENLPVFRLQLGVLLNAIRHQILGLLFSVVHAVGLDGFSLVTVFLAESELFLILALRFLRGHRLACHYLLK